MLCREKVPYCWYTTNTYTLTSLYDFSNSLEEFDAFQAEHVRISSGYPVVISSIVE